MILATKAEALVCPACGQRAMTEPQKFWIGPLRTRACAHCGTRLSIPWSDFLHVSWPNFVAPLAFMASMKLGHLLLELTGRLHHLPEAVEMTLLIVLIFVVPIGLFITFLAWGALRTLDLSPRIGLVIRGAPRA